MAEQALQYIKNAEEEARGIGEKAQEDGARLISDANKKAEQDIGAMEDKCRAGAEWSRQDAMAKAKSEQQVFAADTAHMCDELKQQLLQNKDEAVEAVIRTIAE